jgi:hypothetical protein
MKQLLFVFAAMLCAYSTYAQKNFEGKVVYLMEADKDEKKAELTVFFSKGNIKLVFKENDEPDSKYILVIPDSGRVYTINTYTKKYKSKKLQVTDPAVAFTPVKKSIAGYATTSIKQSLSGPGGMLGGFVSFKNIFFDVADSLVFDVPVKFINNPELMMIQNNHIVLAAQMHMAIPFAEALDEDENAQDKAVKKILVNATNVTPMSMATDEFAIPAGYELEVYKPFDILPDSAAVTPMTDTAMIPVPDYKVGAKKTGRKPVKKPTKKAPVKTAARKE